MPSAAKEDIDSTTARKLEQLRLPAHMFPLYNPL